MKLEIEYVCPNSPCDYRGSSVSEAIKHLTLCKHCPITVEANERDYKATFPHDVGRLLDRACARFVDYMNNETNRFTDDEKNAFSVFYQRLIWALSGEESMQAIAANRETERAS